jgi:hypothetical protein
MSENLLNRQENIDKRLRYEVLREANYHVRASGLSSIEDVLKAAKEFYKFVEGS